MKSWLGTWYLFRRECHRFLKVWIQTLGAPLITSMLYFLIFGAALGGRIGATDGVSYLQFLVPGLVAMGMAQHAFQNTSSSLIQMKYLGMLPADLLALPISPLQMTLAFTGGAILRGILVGLVIGGTAALFVDFGIAHPGLFVAAAVLLCTVFGLIGLITGIWSRTFDNVSMISNFVMTPMIYLGGVFFSIAILPPAWQPVARFNPVYHLVDLFRHSMLDTPLNAPGAAMTAAFAVLLLMFFAATTALARGWGMKS